MSLINKMLLDLDRRHAMAGADQAIPQRHVRAVEGVRAGREWFWRTIVALMLAAVAWVGWIVYQLQSRPLATEHALRAAEDAKSPKPVITTPSVAAAPAPPSQPAKVAAQVETLKMAQGIETPIAATAPKPAVIASSPPAAVAAERPAKVSLARATPADETKAPILLPLELPPAASAGAARVEKRDRVRTPAERAEAEYRRAVVLLNHGRASEAEEGLAAALAQDPAHEAARQALVALLFEHRNFDAARQMLQEGLAINPAHPIFALGLARILVERREYPAALAALEGASGAAAGNAEFHALRGSVLQRLARHREAVEAYQGALRIHDANPQAWIGLGISLEALAQRPEAADAFRRSLAAGPVSTELRNFAEQRARALQ